MLPETKRNLLTSLGRAALLCGMAFLLSEPVAAQTAAADEISQDEIIVTARRKEERLQDVPVAVTALTGEALSNYNATSVGDIATFVPSMVVGRQVTGSSASIFLRGVGSSSLSAGFDQSVSFNIDGLALSRGREIAFAQPRLVMSSRRSTCCTVLRPARTWRLHPLPRGCSGQTPPAPLKAQDSHTTGNRCEPPPPSNQISRPTLLGCKATR